MKQTQTHIPYGFVTALAMIVVYAILEVAKIGDKPGMSLIGMAVFLTGIILNAQAFSKANSADITFGQAFGSGFKASAIVALVLVAWSFIVLKIFPGMEARAMEKAQADMMTRKMTDEQMETAMKLHQKVLSPADGCRRAVRYACNGRDLFARRRGHCQKGAAAAV